MDMKDRVDRFLEVAKSRIEEDPDNIHQFNDLCGDLLDVIKRSKELSDYLDIEYNKIVDEAKVKVWDERFLNVIAGEHEETEAQKLARLTHLMSLGKDRMRRIGQDPTITNALHINPYETQLEQLKHEIRARRETK